MTDILVIGGGPAGLTAAIYGCRAGKSVTVLEKDSVGGQLTSSPLVENYPAVPHVSGMELAALMEQQARDLGALIENEEVIALKKENGIFRASVFGKVYEARSVILATGLEHRMLGLPGEEELIGAGISFCAVCDGPFCTGQDVAVIGGGDAALQEAIFLAGICSKVTLIHRRDSFRAEARLTEKLKSLPNIEIMYNTVTEAYETENGLLTGLRLRSKNTAAVTQLKVMNVFLAVGQVPNNAPYAELAEMTPEGYLLADETGFTKTPGLFAAGDCRGKKLRQASTACADGANAAFAAAAYLDR